MNSIKDSSDLAKYLDSVKADPGNLSAHSEILDYYRLSKERTLMRDHAVSMFHSAKGRYADEMRSLSSIYLIYYYFNTGRKDSVEYYLSEAKKCTGKDSPAYGTLYTLDAECSQAYSADYPAAMESFKKAEEWFGENGYVNDQITMLSRISYLYFMRVDTVGLNYANKAYSLASKTDVPLYKTMAYMNVAHTYDITLDYEKSLKFSDTALAIIKSDSTLYSMLPSVLAIRAQINHELGNDSRADSEFVKSFDYIKYVASPYTLSEIYIAYAKFLYDTGDYFRAKEVYKQGYEADLRNGVNRDDHHFFLGLSKSYLKLGMKDSAIYYDSMYHAAFDKLFEDYTKNEFNRLFSEYETVKLQNEVQENRMMIARLNMLIYIITSVMVIFVLAAAFISYRRKNQMYTRLVEQYRRSEKRIESIKSNEIKKSENKNRNDRELFDRLEKLMKEDKVYHDKDISLEKLADMLGTNRTYMSVVINSYANMTFYNYIHSYRISEAVSLISNPEDTTPLKAVSDMVGYSSLTSFYRAFQRETGCTPVIYRDRVRKVVEEEERHSGKEESGID